MCERTPREFIGTRQVNSREEQVEQAAIISTEKNKFVGAASTPDASANQCHRA